MTPRSRYFSADVLVEILQRLPPSSRRRARLVCRQWRDVVDKRTTDGDAKPSQGPPVEHGLRRRLCLRQSVVPVNDRELHPDLEDHQPFAPL
ncbi:hypothetical protein ZWY2020_054445 [Hordeum vulgare]|nr:hypothetical protein ZWY2020_054430 [Hordeum vulgare]KAI5021035.1 hypothetical protein ZWY2020_054445 [Hordeum vulgare]